MLSAKCGIFLGDRTIAYVWVHGTIKWVGEEFARGVECCVDDRSEALWKSMLVFFCRACALWTASCGVRVVSLHAFSEILDETCSWGVCGVLGI